MNDIVVSTVSEIEQNSTLDENSSIIKKRKKLVIILLFNILHNYINLRSGRAKKHTKFIVSLPKRERATKCDDDDEKKKAKATGYFTNLYLFLLDNCRSYIRVFLF